MIRNKDPSFGFYLRGDASHPLSKKGLSVWEYIRRGEPAEKAGTLVCCRRDSGSGSCSEKKAFEREKKDRGSAQGAKRGRKKGVQGQKACG